MTLNKKHTGKVDTSETLGKPENRIRDSSGTTVEPLENQKTRTLVEPSENLKSRTWGTKNGKNDPRTLKKRRVGRSTLLKH